MSIGPAIASVTSGASVDGDSDALAMMPQVRLATTHRTEARTATIKGQRGRDALAMLGLRHRDGDDAVAPDLQPRPERLLARLDRQVGRIGTRPQAPCDDHPGAHASTDQDVAPA